MLKLPAGCKPVFQQYEVFSLISVWEIRKKGMFEVHFHLSTGHASCPLSSQYRAHVRSTYSTGTAILHSL
jgi:hypothetical protein